MMVGRRGRARHNEEDDAEARSHAQTIALAARHPARSVTMK